MDRKWGRTISFGTNTDIVTCRHHQWCSRLSIYFREMQSVLQANNFAHDADLRKAMQILWLRWIDNHWDEVPYNYYSLLVFGSQLMTFYVLSLHWLPGGLMFCNCCVWGVTRLHSSGKISKTHQKLAQILSLCIYLLHYCDLFKLNIFHIVILQHILRRGCTVTTRPQNISTRVCLPS